MWIAYISELCCCCPSQVLESLTFCTQVLGDTNIMAYYFSFLYTINAGLPHGITYGALYISLEAVHLKQPQNSKVVRNADCQVSPDLLGQALWVGGWGGVQILS